MKLAIFLHRCIQNLSIVVCWLSFIILLPAPFRAIIVHPTFLTPSVVTFAVFIASFCLSLVSQPPVVKDQRPTFLSPWHFQWLFGMYRQSWLYPIIFGAAKGFQALTVIKYIRASLALEKTFITPLIAFFVACISSTVSYLHQKSPQSKSAHIIAETIDFVFNASTSIGFLYLLNHTSPWSLPVLFCGLLGLTALSIFAETDSYQRANLIIVQTIQSFSPERRSAFQGPDRFNCPHSNKNKRLFPRISTQNGFNLPLKTTTDEKIRIL